MSIWNWGNITKVWWKDYTECKKIWCDKIKLWQLKNQVIDKNKNNESMWEKQLYVQNNCFF